VTDKETRAFVLGVVVPGGFFGAVFFYTAPEFWVPAATWSIPVSLVVSLLLCLVPIWSYSSRSGFRPWIFLVSLLLTGLAVMWADVEFGKPGPVSNSLLGNIQTSISWKYRLFVLMPMALCVLAHWVCGFFSLSLVRYLSRFDNDSHSSSGTALLLTGSGFVVLTVLAVGCVTLIQSGPIYLLHANGFDRPTEERNDSLRQLKARLLEDHRAIQSIDSFVGHVDVEHKFAESVFEKQALFEIVPKQESWRGKRRKALVGALKRYEGSLISVLDEPVRPPVPLEPSYASVELNFVPNKDLLSRLGLDPELLATKLAQKLNASPRPQRLQSLTIDVGGTVIPISAIGSIKTVRTEFQAAELPAPGWEPLSLAVRTPETGVLILVQRNRLRMFGLELDSLETTINRHLRTQTPEIDIALLAELSVAETNNGESIRLGDVASVEVGYLSKSRGPASGSGYEIRVE
jgi:hypothetical protein